MPEFEKSPGNCQIRGFQPIRTGNPSDQKEPTMLKKASGVLLLSALCAILLFGPIRIPDQAAQFAVAAASPDAKADAPTVKLPATKTAPLNRYFILHADTNCASLRWIIPDGLEEPDPDIIPQKPKAIILISSTAGVYKVQCYGALGDQASDIATCEVTIGNPPPCPPGPGPNPFGAKALPGLRVLIVYDSNATLSKLPEGQRAIIQGQEVRDFLNQKTIAGVSGQHEWRMWAKDVDPTGETDIWVKAFKRGQKSYPWLLIGNNASGYEGPLPATVADFEALVGKYAAALRKKAA